MNMSRSERNESEPPDVLPAGAPPGWQDAREVMRSEPVAVLSVSSQPPGLLDLARGREPEPGRWARLVRREGEDLPVLEVAQGNVGWLRLLLGVYLRYLQKKAPPRVARQDDIDELSELLDRLKANERRNRDERLELICSTSQLFTLRDAILCAQWLLCDWLPICPEQIALLRPLDLLRADFEKLLDRVLN